MNLAQIMTARALAAKATLIEKEYETILKEIMDVADKGELVLTRRTPHDITIKKLEAAGFEVRVSCGHCAIQFY